METKTIDAIVRESLIEAGLTLHFYMKYLYFCLKEFEHLAKKHRYFYKQTELTINSYKRVTIPSDFRGIIDLSERNGERLESLFRDDSLNRMYNYDDEGNKIAWPQAEEAFNDTYTIYNNDGEAINSGVLGSTGWYGLSKGDDKAFTIDTNNNEIVFTNKMEANAKVVLTYSTDPIDATTANVVDHMFVDTLKTYMHYCQLDFGNAPQYEVRRAWTKYKNAKRELNAFLRPITYARLMNLLRKGIHGGLKN